MKINATKYLTDDYPPELGKKLALEVLGIDLDWGEIEIDVRDIAAGVLISVYFNNFLQTIYELAPRKLDMARKINWETRYDFQADNIVRWITEFKPYPKRA